MRLKEFLDMEDETLDQMLEVMDTPEFQRWFAERHSGDVPAELRDPCDPYQE